MANYHFIGGDGKEYGPYSLEELRQFMAEDRLNAQTQIQVDDGAFQPASSLPELMGAPAPLPPVSGTMAGMPPPTIRPGKLQAIAIMTLVGGILATLIGLAWIVYCLLLGIFTLGISCIGLPFAIYELIAGILCIIQGSKLLGNNPDPYYAKTKTTAIMQIVCIICCDGVNLTLGIINLVFLNDEEVKAYIRSKGGQI